MPILDINGGTSGKPILRKATLSSIFSLIEFPDSNSISPGLTVPTIIKTVAASDDYFIGIDNSGIAYKITKADFLAGLSSGGSQGGGNQSNQFNYVADGDSNGVFYFIGTSGKTVDWSTPTAKGLKVSASGAEYGSPAGLVDRQPSMFYSPNTPGSWVIFDLGVGHSLICNYYSIQSRNQSTDYYPRNWNLQGSNDGHTWTALDLQVNNTSLQNNSQWLSLPVASSTAYRYFQLISTGLDSSNSHYFVLGQVELYGLYI